MTREEFQEAYCELCTRPDVYFLMVQLAKDRECLDSQDLRLFLETEQGLSLATTEGCLELLRRYDPSAQGKERGLLGLDGFARYLQSPECQLLDPEHEGVCQDMNMPLSHYYIRYPMPHRCEVTFQHSSPPYKCRNKLATVITVQCKNCNADEGVMQGKLRSQITCRSCITLLAFFIFTSVKEGKHCKK